VAAEAALAPVAFAAGEVDFADDPLAGPFALDYFSHELMPRHSLESVVAAL
jgi:hypothetical protein